jgi:hypothetical protein
MAAVFAVDGDRTRRAGVAVAVLPPAFGRGFAAGLALPAALVALAAAAFSVGIRVAMACSCALLSRV